MTFPIFIPEQAPTIEIIACKYNGSVHRTWSCQLINETDDLYIFYGTFEKEIKHPLLGVIRPGTISVEFYWKNRWYNVFRFFEPNGSFRNFYCNINLPPVLKNKVLTYVDLDIDVLVEPNLSYQILDLDEFSEHAQTQQYPILVIENAQRALNEVIELIKLKQFPFDSPYS